MASLFMCDSSSATIASTNSMMLLVESSVLRFSCSNSTGIGGSCSFRRRTQLMQSIRFRANRLTDFVTIMSILPDKASFIMR